MKTKIAITGQIGGNHTLLDAIPHYPFQKRKGRFYGFTLFFDTKKEAVEALAEAYQRLKDEEPEFAKEGGINYKRGEHLEYDASVAKIKIL